MPRAKKGRKAVTVTLLEEEYETIKTLAAKKNTSMDAVLREYVKSGLNGTLSESNMDFIVPIIREQLQDILNMHINRLAAIEAKTCIQAGTAAYLTAETLSRFMPAEKRLDFNDAYDGARKKAVQYLKGAKAEE